MDVTCCDVRCNNAWFEQGFLLLLFDANLAAAANNYQEVEEK